MEGLTNVTGMSCLVGRDAVGNNVCGNYEDKHLICLHIRRCLAWRQQLEIRWGRVGGGVSCINVTGTGL